ncbi:hypothetical protein COU18_01675 [Candidatus Kaiserbacteria bacterium CG10_big_fil_rev_8_21_14_0_10_51_14]|uniref:Uncharacterized protein n=1 Tax=Candidatus Kaiserbacteria bacterium CG10_big_fil_rev_8_21_14_0_10_51_14 TaxID=1974610 RepID=A0A2H0UCG8_9BACT|nr:MAG: hypothetical protein COU18_01675 [Candidatus Kaiserbacteria bacterium CG10_big_fil_rev_8_21_14_0_10_51_14]
MSITALILAAGVVAHVSGTACYLWRTLKGRTKPNRVSFFIWSLAPLIGVSASLSDGVGWAALPVFMAGFGPLLIFGASFVNPNAYWQLRKLDYACGAFSLLALVLWAITQDPFWAVFFAIVSDVLASWPTILKSWRYPETEYFSAYAGAAFSSLTALIVAESLKFTEIAFPLMILVACAIILTGIFRKRLFPQR